MQCLSLGLVAHVSNECQISREVGKVSSDLQMNKKCNHEVPIHFWSLYLFVCWCSLHIRDGMCFGGTPGVLLLNVLFSTFSKKNRALASFEVCNSTIPHAVIVDQLLFLALRNRSCSKCP